MDLKSYIPKKLLWVDLEMTGLDANEDLILEIAAEITDLDFKTLDSYESIVAQPKDQVIDRMQKNTWWASYPENRDEFLSKVDIGKPAKDVENDLIELIKKNFGDEPAVLCGNSIHSDRAFIKKAWPNFDLKLHYRMIDVSSWKLIMMSKYGVNYQKNDVHRAFDDIQASIAELQYYLAWFKDN